MSPERYSTLLLDYGVSSSLAERTKTAGLTLTSIRALSRKALVAKYGLTDAEVSELKKCVVRRPIDTDTAELLLSRSSYLCCMCKGRKGDGVILHHIVEYEKTQDNGYHNLAVLCPNDHDRAHNGGLTVGWTVDQIRKAKARWEGQVEESNARKAARSIEVHDEAVDYVNIPRIEELCLRRLGHIPETRVSRALRRAGILDPDLRFDERTVWSNFSGGGYLFDYVNSHETDHYRELLRQLSDSLDFEDLAQAVRSGIRKLKSYEGRYAFFIGGVASRRPERPVQRSQPFEWRYTKGKVRIVWHGEAKYLMSSSAISRQGGLNSYIIYCLVRSVNKLEDGRIDVVCSPLMAAQPTVTVNRTPTIAYRKALCRRLEWQDDVADSVLDGGSL